MDTLLLDLRYALGRFRQQWLATAIIVITLGLGIGATTAIFSVVNGVMLNATPFADAERLVLLQQSQPKVDNTQLGFSALEIADYREQASSLAEVAEFHSMTFTMYGHGDPMRVRTGVVSSNFFPMLGLEPIIGRTFNPAEDDLGAAPLIVLTEEFWTASFGRDPGVIGQTVEMNNRAHEIIGVLPAFPQFPNINDVYMAIPSCPWRSGETALTNRSARFLAGFGKLREDIDVEQSATEMSAIAERISVAYPADYPPELGFGSTTLLLRNELVKGSSSYLLILLGTTLMVLLISCANVTNLILSQHAKRQREFAVRASLGATRGMLAKQLLLESILLALMGGLLGLALSWLGIDVLRGFALHFTTRSSQIMINSEVMIFVLVISLITGIVAGVVPSLARQKLVTSLKEGGKASVSSEANPIRNGLLIVQFGLSLTLLVAAGLSIKSLAEIDRVEPGFDPNQTEATQLDLNWTSYPNPPDQWQFTQNILREVRALPYVSEAGAGLTYPMDSFAAGFNQVRGGIQFDDRPFDPNFVLDSTYLRPVSGGYFDALGIDLLQGRAFSDHDDAQAPLVAVISRATALSLWPGPDVIDKQFSFDNGITWTRIIGVVDDTKEQGLTGETGQKIYLPLAQSPALHVAVVARLSPRLAPHIARTSGIC